MAEQRLIIEMGMGNDQYGVIIWLYSCHIHYRLILELDLQASQECHRVPDTLNDSQHR